jgi:hypothetical protein
LHLRGRLYQRVPYFQGARKLEIANDVYGEVAIAPMPMSVLLYYSILKRKRAASILYITPLRITAL